jgi:proline racemase
VASYLHLRDASVEVAGLGHERLDLAWGGNFYAIVSAESVSVPVHPPSIPAGSIVPLAASAPRRGWLRWPRAVN